MLFSFFHMYKDQSFTPELLRSKGIDQIMYVPFTQESDLIEIPHNLQVAIKDVLDTFKPGQKPIFDDNMNRFMQLVKEYQQFWGTGQV